MAARQEPFELALQALGRKERSTVELMTWLRGRGCAEDEIEDVVARLVEVGELDDGRFAVRFAEDKRELADWGADRIRAALLERGIDPELIEAAVAAESDDEQADRAAALLARRGQPLADDAQRNRALGFLVRRGYGYEVAYEAVRRHERTAS